MLRTTLSVVAVLIGLSICSGEAQAQYSKRIQNNGAGNFNAGGSRMIGPTQLPQRANPTFNPYYGSTYSNPRNYWRRVQNPTFNPYYQRTYTNPR